MQETCEQKQIRRFWVKLYNYNKDINNLIPPVGPYKLRVLALKVYRSIDFICSMSTLTRATLIERKKFLFDLDCGYYLCWNLQLQRDVNNRDNLINKYTKIKKTNPIRSVS